MLALRTTIIVFGCTSVKQPVCWWQVMRRKSSPSSALLKPPVDKTLAKSPKRAKGRFSLSLAEERIFTVGCNGRRPKGKG